MQTSFAEFIAWSHQRGFQLIGTSAHAIQSYLNFQPEGNWLLVLGSEQKGLSAEQLESCDVGVSLPMRGRAGSLNLAVAAGILLYQFAA